MERRELQVVEFLCARGQRIDAVGPAFMGSGSFMRHVQDAGSKFFHASSGSSMSGKTFCDAQTGLGMATMLHEFSSFIV